MKTLLLAAVASVIALTAAQAQTPRSFGSIIRSREPQRNLLATGLSPSLPSAPPLRPVLARLRRLHPIQIVLKSNSSSVFRTARSRCSIAV